MAKRNVVKAAIDRIFDAELANLPKIKNLPKGQIEEFRGKFLEFMIQDIAKGFMLTKSMDTKLAIAKFFFDYSGHKPKIEVEAAAGKNPYALLSMAELEAEQRKLISE